MDYELLINELSESRRAIGIKIKRPVFEQQVQKAARSLSTKAEIKGFRKGKAPIAMIQKMYGERLRLDVVEDYWREASQQLQNDPNLPIFGFSNMHVEDKVEDSDVAINVEATLFPQPKLENLKGLEISYESENFTDKLVDDALVEAQRRGAKTSPITDREIAEPGDLVHLSYEATVDGEPFPGSSEASSYVEIGSGRSVADLEKGLIGKKVGEKSEITVVFPADYPQEAVREKTGIYKVEILGLERAELPELTDEYVKENLGADSVAELKEKFEKRIRRRLEERNETSKMTAIFKALYEANQFEIGDLIVEEQMRNQLMRFGVLNPNDRQSLQQDVSRFKPLLGEQAKMEVAQGFLATALVKQYKVEPTAEEIDTWITEQSERFDSTPEEIKKEFDFKNDPDRLTEIVAKEMAVEKLLSDSKITENPKA